MNFLSHTIMTLLPFKLLSIFYSTLRVLLFYNVLNEVWYMQSSRLHFIGTWRNRYRKRFPISSTGFNNEISNINASDISRKSIIIHVDMVSFMLGKKLLLSTNSFDLDRYAI